MFLWLGTANPYVTNAFPTLFEHKLKRIDLSLARGVSVLCSLTLVVDFVRISSPLHR